MLKPLSIPLQLSFGTFVCLSTSPILAQVTSDGTVNTQVNLQENISEITGGEARGSNLFHSFQDFSVPTGNEAFFNNAESISNIFSRVTGGNISNIDGLIRANGSASLFLINPAGIVFGENARLDIGGSFFGSTADSILFNDGEFSATDLDNPLLTINAPIGLNFRDNPGDITVRGDGQGVRTTTDLIDTEDALRVGSEATFALLGGNLNLEGATIRTAGGRIELGSIEGNQQVNLTSIDETFNFDYQGVENFRDIQLSQTAAVDASGLGAGEIKVQGKNITLVDDSSITNTTLGSESGGSLEVNASETLELIGGTTVKENTIISTAISARVRARNGSNLTLNANNLSIKEGAFISTSVFGEGNGGNLNINASNSIDLSGTTVKEDLIIPTTIEAFVAQEATGNAGNTEINTNSLTLSNGAVLNATSSGQGNAGNVTINATDSIVIEGNDPNPLTNVAINTGVSGENALGNAGNIEITTNFLSVNNGIGLFTNNDANGRAGNITIDATEDVSFANNSQLFVIGAPGGSIDLSAKNLSITSGSSLFAGTFGETGSAEAQSRDITINLAEDLILDGLESNDSTSITNSSFGTGNPGNINISARNITFQNGGNINNFSQEQEVVRIGDVTLNATGDIVFDGIRSSNRSGISNFIPENTSGSIGAINVTAQNLTLTNGAQISSQVSGTGDSGNINLDVANSIKIDGFSDISTDDLSGTLASQILSGINSTGNGNAGTININTQNLELSRNGSIEADVFGIGNGGDINLNAERITIGQQGSTNTLPSRIAAETFGNAEGNGGNITIDTGSLFISDGGSIDVDINRGVGNGGNIKINARDTVSVEGSGIFRDNPEFSSRITATTFDSDGNAGDIEINTANLSVADTAFVSANIFPSLDSENINNSGDGGSIIINASDSIDVFGGGSIDADLGQNSTGNAGNLTLSTQRLNIEDGAQISADTLGSGNGGDVVISTGNLTISDGTRISANTFGSGNGGSLTITATESIELDGSTETEFVTGIFANAEGNGNGGDVVVSTDNLTISNGAQISTITSEDGNAGSLRITATKSIELDGSTETELTTGIFSDAQGSGNGGDVVISTGNLTISDAAQISAETLGDGNGGSLTVTATESIKLDNSTGFEAGILADAEGDGNGGDVVISTGNLTINNAIISATTLGDGNGGSLTVTAIESIELDNSTEFDSGIFAAAIGNGNGGDVNISTSNLTISNGAAIFVPTFGDGNGGSLTINATESIDLDNSTEFTTGIFADAVGNGDSGDVVISTGDLTISGGARISTITSGDGNGGSLTITATESIELDGSTEAELTTGIIASALEGSGNGGDVVISTGDLTISDGASVAASNFSSLGEENGGAAPGTGQPGEIEITADSISLFDRGRIQAVTQSAEGGANITLQVNEDITLRDESSISAQAIGSGNGGNLTIDSRFIIAFPSDGNGSDIIASAEQGQGGNITISAESLLGIQERPLGNLTNDINASSQISGLDGTIDITNPEVDPVQGATELPSNVVEAGETTQQVCQANGESSASNTLTIGGKGGLFPNLDYL